MSASGGPSTEGEDELRIVVQALTAAPGGSLTVLRDLLAAWPAEDELLIITWREDAVSALAATGHQLHRVRASSTPEALLRLRAARPTLKVFKPEIVWSQAVRVPIAGLPQAVHWRDVGSFTDVHTRSIRRSVKEVRERSDLMRVDLRLFNSEAMARAVWNRHPKVRGLPYAIAYNGLDLRPFLSVGPRLSSGERPLRLLLPQGDSPHKQNVIAADVTAELMSDPPPPYSGVELTVPGHGKYEELKRRLTDKGLASVCRFTGYVDRSGMGDLYQACDVVLITSAGESFCNPAIEAAAVGRPLVSGPIPVLRETAGPLGVIADSGDARSLAVCVRRAVALTDVASMQRKARQHAMQFAAERRALGLRQELVRLLASV